MRTATFIPAFDHPERKPSAALWFVFQNRKIILPRFKNGVPQPFLTDTDGLKLPAAEQLFFGTLDGKACYAATLKDSEPLPDRYEAIGLRQLLGVASETLMSVAGCARQWIHWQRMHRYCGHCGHPTENHRSEHAKVCTHCGRHHYPKITPAIIVAVVRTDKILLARSARYRNSLFSVLAGFVEPGETLESAVQREIYEEVHLDVCNIRYFGSQPWPFPSSMMIAFTADYAAGDLAIDGDEIIEAGWFSADRLPQVPGPYSISGRLIEWFKQNHHVPAAGSVQME